MVNTWSLEEYNNIFDNYSIQGLGIIPNLQNRSKATVVKKALMLGQSEPQPLTLQEKEFIKAHGKTLKSATAFFICGHSPKEITNLVGKEM